MNDFQRRMHPTNRVDRHDWYRISNSAGDTARVEIYDFIGYDPWWDEGVDAKKFAKDLGEIRASTIELHINSPGGFVTDGILIYNALRDHVGAENRVTASDQRLRRQPTSPARLAYHPTHRSRSPPRPLCPECSPGPGR
jgi:hypothetical protein